MTDRERLIELLKDCLNDETIELDDGYVGYGVRYEKIADHLLANGVIVPPCKVGDKLYIITNISQEIVESVVIGVWMADGVFSILTIHGTILNESLGKTVFLTKEEAERELAKRGE